MFWAIGITVFLHVDAISALVFLALLLDYCTSLEQ